MRQCAFPVTTQFTLLAHLTIIGNSPLDGVPGLGASPSTAVCAPQGKHAHHSCQLLLHTWLQHVTMRSAAAGTPGLIPCRPCMPHPKKKRMPHAPTSHHPTISIRRRAVAILATRLEPSHADGNGHGQDQRAATYHGGPRTTHTPPMHVPPNRGAPPLHTSLIPLQRSPSCNQGSTLQLVNANVGGGQWCAQGLHCFAKVI